MNITDRIQITNEDNMQLMGRYPDNYFDLAIVDPPYGIDINKAGWIKQKKQNKPHTDKNWDSEIPPIEYFIELFRVSKEQIIWGGNYFTKFLPPSRCFLIWDKVCRMDQADCEMAWCSFNTSARIFKYARGNESGFAPKSIQTDKMFSNIHPTQKPVALYKWLLNKYAKQGDKILDTHLGSGSIALACHDYGFELTACELDLEYYNKAVKRINNHVSQTKLFV